MYIPVSLGWGNDAAQVDVISSGNYICRENPKTDILRALALGTAANISVAAQEIKRIHSAGSAHADQLVVEVCDAIFLQRYSRPSSIYVSSLPRGN